MSEAQTLKASARSRAGKGASRALRRDARVPAVIYGGGEVRNIHLEEKALVKALSSGHFLNTRYVIDVDGATEPTLPRDVQFNVVTDRPIHVDFLRLGAGTRIVVAVPVRFTDEELSPGIKRGATVNVVRHEIELMVDADNIPDEIVISLAGRDVPDSIHISSVTLPAGATPAISDRDFTIATIAAPSAMRSADDAASGVEAPAAA